ncbi:MAG: hypothetical protein LBF40_01680 [Deltaproteobacteria bacterium]|nr:hypothetical protein [Deltaproteobacteria bacterium]
MGVPPNPPSGKTPPLGPGPAATWSKPQAQGKPQNPQPAPSGAGGGAKPQGKATKAPKPGKPGDPEDIILTYFTTPEGQVSLKKIKEELTKTGLGANSPVLDKLNEKSPKSSPIQNFTSAISKGFGGIRRLFGGGGQSSLKRKISEYDLTFVLALSPEAAKSGTTVDLQYYQDGKDRHLSIHVPPNTKANTRLRLAGQGNRKPDKSRGDLLLTISIPGKPGAMLK